MAAADGQNDLDLSLNAVDQARMAIFDTDSFGKIRRANAHAARMFGYDSPAAMIADVTHTRDLFARAADRDVMRARLARGENVANVVIEMRRRDGSTFWAVHGVEAKPGSDGPLDRTVGWFVETGDVIDRRSAVEPIDRHFAESEFLAQLFGATDIGIYEADDRCRILRANEAFARMFGYGSVAEMRAAMPDGSDAVYADLEDHTRLVDRLISEGTIREALWQARRRDGTLFWVRQSAIRVEGPPMRMIGTVADVTQLVEAWAEVQRAEANYRSMFENASHGIFRSSREGKQLRANPALVALNGYDSEEELLAAVGNIAHEWYVEPGRRDEFIRRVERDGRVLDFESEVYRHKTRERIWVSESAWVVRGQDGRVLYYEGMIEDITARKRVELALAAAKAEVETAAADLRSIYDNANVGIFRTIPGGAQTRSNLALARLNGFDTVEEQIEAVRASLVDGKTTGWYVDPARRDEYRRQMRENGRLDNFISEIRRRKTGERIWISETAWVVRDAEGKIVAYEGTVVDVTERILAERALAEAKAEAERLAEDYRSIFENANFGIYRTDANWRQLAVNPALLRINGFERPEQQIAANPAAGEKGESWYVEAGRRELFRGIMAREGRIAGFESEVVRRTTGERIWVSENAWAVRDRDGKTVAYEGTVEDVTVRKHTETALREAKAEAEAASAAKSAFLAVMSHELRTPLNAIIGFAEVVAGKLFGAQDARYFEYAEYIRQSGTHLLNLINDILDLSKIGAGQFDLQETEFELDRLAEDVVRLFAANASKGGVALVLGDGFPQVSIRGDALRLKQVLMNLVSNAIKFTPQGGSVTLSSRLTDTTLCVCVADTGIGMTPAEAKRAMEPFVQIDDGLARKHGGTGLGLPISNQLVMLHGGKLVVDSDKGKGTKVTVELPLARVVAPF
jgi:PAS domain S-box-containing protein